VTPSARSEPRDTENLGGLLILERLKEREPVHTSSSQVLMLAVEHLRVPGRSLRISSKGPRFLVPAHDSMRGDVMADQGSSALTVSFQGVMAAPAPSRSELVGAPEREISTVGSVERESTLN